MRYFVRSRFDPNQKVYISFQGQPLLRSHIPFVSFSVIDINGLAQIYTRAEVFAEVGSEPAGAALVVGALLFFIDPLLGILGGLGSGILAQSSEEDKVKAFNASPVW